MRCGVVRDSYSTVRGLTFVLPSGTAIDTAAPDADERVRRRRARARRGAGRDPRRDPGRRRARRPDPPQVRDQEHHRLPAVRLPRRRRRRSRSSAGCWSAPRGPWRSSPRPSSRPCPAAAHDHRLAPLRRHRRGRRAGARPGRRGRHRGRADGRPGADRGALRHAGRAAGLAASCRPTRRRCWSSSAAPTTAELDAAEARGRRGARRPRAGREPPTSPATPRRSSSTGGCARACTGCVGKLRPPGTSLIIEDVCVPPARIAESAEDIQALLGEHGFLPGVAGHASAGNLHFMLTPDFAKPEDLERYEAFMDEPGRADPRQVRRLAQGRARHRASTWRPTSSASGAPKATELMWRVKRLADPDGVLAPGVVLNRDPGVHLQNLKSTPPIEEVGQRLRRVRLLRAGLPEPRPDDDAAPADRAAARDGAAAGRARRCSEALLARVRVRRRSRPAPPTAPARSPARSASTPASWSRSFARARARRRARSGGRWPPPSAGRRSSGCARGPGWRRAGAARRAARTLTPARAASWCRVAERAAPAPPAAGDRARGRRRRLFPGLHQPDLRQLAQDGARMRCRRRWSRSRRARACRSGSPTTSPGTAARRRGARRATQTDAHAGWPTRPSRRSGAGATRARCRS